MLFFFFSQLAIKPITSLQIMCVCYSVKVWTCRTVAAIRPLCVKKSLLFAVNFNSQCESREIISTYTVTAPFQGKNLSFFKHCIWNNKHCSQEEFQYSCCRVQLCFFLNLPDLPRGCSMERWWPSVFIKKLFFSSLLFSKAFGNFSSLALAAYWSTRAHAEAQREGSAAVCNTKQSSLTLSKWSSGRGRSEMAQKGLVRGVSWLAGMVKVGSCLWKVST